MPSLFSIHVKICWFILVNIFFINSANKLFFLSIFVATNFVFIFLNPSSPHDALKHHFTSLKRDFPTSKAFRIQISMKLVYQYMTIFFNFSLTLNNLHPLQVVNYDSNLRLVVDEGDIVKSGLKGLMPLPPPRYIYNGAFQLIHSTLSAYMKMNSLRFEDLTLKCKDVARKNKM